MCGIIGYVGFGRDAIQTVLKGLERLEYRGYDSAGIAALNGDGSVFLKKSVGRVNKLAAKIGQPRGSFNCAIAHTRWATHGVPSEKNAHPHHDCQKNIFVVHNGIIENYSYLKEVLSREGHIFSSLTDTEVLSHLIERQMTKYTSLEDAVIEALFYVKGTFAIAVVSASHPDKIVAACHSSPLIVGLGEKEHFLASDVSALTDYTKRVVYLNDDEIAVLTPDSFSFLDLNKKAKRKEIDLVDWDTEQAQKGGYKHFMLKEIHLQPDSVKDSLRGRLIEEEGKAKLGGLEILGDKLKDISRLIIIGCGTAYYAGMVGKYMMENYAGLPCEISLASEFRYGKPVLGRDTALLAISQSGETADTLAAVNLAKRKGAIALGIVNSVGSSIARLTDAGVYNHIGPEIGVASTKAFTSQLAVLALFTLFFGRERGMKKKTAQELIKALYLIPAQIKQILKTENRIKLLAKKYCAAADFLFLGRNYNYPTALEGALKLKEISYIHAEGYAAGEMKHGPIALIDKNFPTIAIFGNKDSETYEKMISNVQEIKARGGPAIAVAEEGDENVLSVAEDVVYVPKTLEALSPMLNVIPLQLFAYYMAALKGLDPDKPRNLAKSVTVE